MAVLSVALKEMTTAEERCIRREQSLMGGYQCKDTLLTLGGNDGIILGLSLGEVDG